MHHRLQVVAEDVGHAALVDVRIEIRHAARDEVHRAGEAAERNTERPRPVPQLADDLARRRLLTVDVVDLEPDGHAAADELGEERVDLVHAHAEEVVPVLAEPVALRERSVLPDPGHDPARRRRRQQRLEPVRRQRAPAGRSQVHVLVVDACLGLHPHSPSPSRDSPSTWLEVQRSSIRAWR